MTSSNATSVPSPMLGSTLFMANNSCGCVGRTFMRSRNDSVGTLAKACLFVRINEWKLIEFTQQAIDERDEALKSVNLPTQGHGYV
jgi:hypothetical protein